jgi:uncharacterized protein
MFERIVVGVTKEATGRDAGHRADQLAAAFGATVHYVYVFGGEHGQLGDSERRPHRGRQQGAPGHAPRARKRAEHHHAQGELLSTHRRDDLTAGDPRGSARRRGCSTESVGGHMSDRNLETVKQVYAAFGAGDVETILASIAENVDWASEPDGHAPWHGVHKGKGEVQKFFGNLGTTVEVLEFTPLTFASNGTDVLTVVRFAMRSTATGKQGAMDIHHWFHFDADGKIDRYRGTEDTALTYELLSK